MAIVTVSANLDYVVGHLRYGHREGALNIPNEDLELFYQDPVKYITDHDLEYDLDVIVDDYEIEGTGDIYEVSILDVKEE